MGKLPSSPVVTHQWGSDAKGKKICECILSVSYAYYVFLLFVILRMGKGKPLLLNMKVHANLSQDFNEIVKIIADQIELNRE